MCPTGRRKKIVPKRLIKWRFVYEDEMDGIGGVCGVGFDSVFVSLLAKVLCEEPERKG
jgi:hypothetical protein